MTKSTHRSETIEIKMSKHPGADTLSIIPIYGYNYVGKTEAWQDCKMGVWLPPDSLVDTTRVEFADLKADARYDENSLPCKGGPYARIKAKNLRGIQSYGYLIKAPEGAKPGDDLTEHFGIKHYEAELIQVAEKQSRGIFIGGEIAPAPEGIDVCYYDIDAFLRYYKDVFEPNETVISFEKLEGCNGCYVYSGGEFHCRSRNEWKREFASPPKVTLQDLIEKMKDEVKAKEVYENKIVNYKPTQNLWWKVLRSDEKLQKFLQDNPGYVVYGEVYSQVKNFLYDGTPGKPRFRAFDIRHNSRFLDIKPAMELGRDLTWAPILDESPLDFEKLTQLATGNTVLGPGTHIKEGIVVRGLKEKWVYSCGRNVLKLKNPDYLNKH